MDIPEFRILLAGRDISALDRLTRAAQQVPGASVVGAPPERLPAYLRDNLPFDVLVLDLDEGGDQILGAVDAARAEALLPARLLGYFSHVSESVGERARAAGVEAYPRSRFWRELPTLLAPGDEPN